MDSLLADSLLGIDEVEADDVPGFEDLYETVLEWKGRAANKQRGRPKPEPPKSMRETIAETTKKVEWDKGKTAPTTTMKPPFENVPKPVPTIDRINEEGGKFKLTSETEHQAKIDEDPDDLDFQREWDAIQDQRESKDLLEPESQDSEDQDNEDEKDSEFYQDALNALGDANLPVDDPYSDPNASSEKEP